MTEQSLSVTKTPRVIIIETETSKYNLTVTSYCGISNVKLKHNTKIISSFPLNTLSEYAIELASIVIMKHEGIRQRINFQGKCDSILPVKEAVLIPLKVLS